MFNESTTPKHHRARKRGMSKRSRRHLSDIRNVSGVPDCRERNYPKGGRFGRIIKIRYPIGIPSHAEYLGSFSSILPTSKQCRDTKAEQIKGIAIVHETITALLLALRGGKEKSNRKKKSRSK